MSPDQLGQGWRRWEDWWLRPVPADLLGLFRIVFGLFLLLYWGLMLPDVPLLLSRQGLVQHVIDPYVPAALTPLLAPPSGAVAVALFSLFLLGIVAFTLGVLTRWAGALLIVFHAYFWGVSLHLTWFTIEHLMPVLIAILAFGGSDRAFSLRMQRRHGSWRASEPVSVLAQRLIAVQICATFLGVGWQKAWLPDWKDGTILHVALMGRWATPLGYWVAGLPLPAWFYDGLIVVVKCFEVCLPIGLWSPRWRGWWILGMFLFLFQIALLLSFWWFLILVPLSLSFYEPEALATRLRPARLPRHA